VSKKPKMPAMFVLTVVVHGKKHDEIGGRKLEHVEHRSDELAFEQGHPTLSERTTAITRCLPQENADRDMLVISLVWMIVRL